MSQFQSTRFQHAPSRPTRGDSPFSFSPLAVLLLIVLAGLCIFIPYYRISNTGPGTGLVSKLSTSGTITLYVFIFLVCAAIAGGIGALTHFLSGRRAGSANLGICAVLLLANGALGYSLYNNHQSMTALRQQAQQRQQPMPQPSALTPPRPAPGSGASGSSSFPQPSFPTPNAQPAAPAPPQPAPSRAVKPHTPPKPTTEPAADLDTKFVELAATLGAEVEAEFSALSSEAKQTLTAISKKPVRDRVEIEKRAKAAAKLRDGVKDLRDRVMNFNAEAHRRLTEAGLEDMRARSLAIDIERKGSWNARMGALARIDFAADAGADEAKLLLDNYASWRIAGGQIESKDMAVQSRLRGARSRTESMTRDTTSMIEDLAPPASR
jgi:hypothetical protein